MKKLIFLSLLVSSFNLIAECIYEKTVTGLELKTLKNQSGEIFVETEEAIYKSLTTIKIEDQKLYKIQINETVHSHNKNAGDYNSKYIEYYTYARMQKYLNSNKDLIEAAGLEIRTIGKSINGRDLYAVTPKNLLKKKTILMFGRHHGDEGTANWIIEGFFNDYLNNKKFRDEYQLLLYPMINPDGTEAHTRYNANGRDLNRSWNANPAKGYDEIKTIHGDLAKFMQKINDDIFITLDMHGSFKEDFIYRVNRNYVSIDFYNKQQNFIDELGIYDPWQAGNFILSDGDPGMARIVLINHYKKNALTHESIRDIPLNNRTGRSKHSLMEQGEAITKTITNLF